MISDAAHDDLRCRVRRPYSATVTVSQLPYERAVLGTSPAKRSSCCVVLGAPRWAPHPPNAGLVCKKGSGLAEVGLRALLRVLPLARVDELDALDRSECE